MRHRLREHIQVAAMLVFVSLMFTITFLLTEGFYAIIGWTPPLLPMIATRWGAWCSPA